MTPADRHQRHLAAQAATLAGDVLQELGAIRARTISNPWKEPNG